MKSPCEWASKLARQWQQPSMREARLLSAKEWPLKLKIGTPSAAIFSLEPERVREHVQSWRRVQIGEVLFEAVSYRASSEPIKMPSFWQLNSPSDWIAAIGDETIQAEFEIFGRLVRAIAEPVFHPLIVRQRRLVLDRPEAEVIKAAQVAMALEPDCAAGRPLRALTACNIDSKFLERNRTLLIQMLDLRFDGMVSELGLEQFLDALDEREHWVLIAPLSPGLLPFRQQRVRISELALLPASISHLLVVENERCLHQLPQLANTVAVLGAGLNLSWMQDDWLSAKRLAYWGDLDTWGLLMLARARLCQPAVSALLMTRECFDRYEGELAVNEPTHAGETAPDGLTPPEKELYSYLRSRERGRLEQEFLPATLVADELVVWRS